MIDKTYLNNQACELRKKLGEDDLSPVDIFYLVQNISNLTLIFYPLGKNISGVCYKGKRSNIIAINSSMSLGRQRFSLAHELYHMYYDKSVETSISMISIGSGAENEKMADQFASYFLAPQVSLYRFIKNLKEKSGRDELSLEDVIKIEQYYGLSHKAILYRLLNDRELSEKQVEEMSVAVVDIARRLGYDTSIYKPSPHDRKRMSLGYYIKKSEKLLNENYISQGKYESLLLDAFRDDIVYGVDSKEEISFD